MNYNHAIISQASKCVGQKEHAGRASNPVIEAHFARAGFPGLTDETPWCAAFVGSILAECGLKPSGSLMARSYLTYGRKVSQQDAQIGDIGVIARGKPPQGHVFFIAGFEGSNVLALGGNQGDEVSIHKIPMASLIGIRRADPAAASGLGTVQEGDVDTMVVRLQTTLKGLGYFSGKVDGQFGPLTRKAVMAFQSDNPPLEVDGIAGDRTWTAIKAATPPPPRDVTADDLRKRGSDTIKVGDAQSTGAIVGMGGIGLAGIQSAIETAQQSQGVLEWAGAYVAANWQLIGLFALFLGGWLIARWMIAERVRKAATGQDLSL